MSERQTVRAEPWLRGTLTEVDAVARGVLHALELAHEDVTSWCSPLFDEQLNARPAGLASVAFHVRHIARSLDRLLTYAEGGELSEAQLAALKSELQPGATRTEVFAEFDRALQQSAQRILSLANKDYYSAARFVGKKKLPTTLGGLLVHIADHTQRHVGQAIITAKVVSAVKVL